MDIHLIGGLHLGVADVGTKTKPTIFSPIAAEEIVEHIEGC